jgi:hypothetical protein
VSSLLSQSSELPSECVDALSISSAPLSAMLLLLLVLLVLVLLWLWKLPALGSMPLMWHVSSDAFHLSPTLLLDMPRHQCRSYTRDTPGSCLRSFFGCGDMSFLGEDHFRPRSTCCSAGCLRNTLCSVVAAAPCSSTPLRSSTCTPEEGTRWVSKAC